MKELDNLVSINELKREPADAKEFAGMVRVGGIKHAEIVNWKVQTIS